MIHIFFSKNGARMCFKNGVHQGDLYFAVPEAMDRINLYELRRYARGRDFTIVPLHKDGIDQLTAALAEHKTVSWF